MPGTFESECKIWLGGRKSFIDIKGIAYSSSSALGDNGFNELMTVHDDGYSLFLKSMGIFMIGRTNGQEHLSPQRAAEYFWAILIQQLQ